MTWNGLRDRPMRARPTDAAPRRRAGTTWAESSDIDGQLRRQDENVASTYSDGVEIDITVPREHRADTRSLSPRTLTARAAACGQRASVARMSRPRLVNAARGRAATKVRNRGEPSITRAPKPVREAHERRRTVAVDDDGAAGTQLAQSVRCRHRIVTDGVRATDTPVGTNADLLFSEGGSTRPVSQAHPPSRDRSMPGRISLHPWLFRIVLALSWP